MRSAGRAQASSFAPSSHTHVGGLWADKRGVTLVYVAILLPLMVALLLLAVSLNQQQWGRAEYQRVADAIASAAAAELDGRADAQSRAQAAASQIAAQFSLPASICWSLSFPVSQNASFGDISRLAQVDVRSSNYPAQAASCASNAVAASATGRFGPGLCRAPPLLVCNPYEALGVSIFDVDQTPFSAGGLGLMRQWRLRPAGSSSPAPAGPWTTYGLVDPRGIGGSGQCRTDTSSIDSTGLLDGVAGQAPNLCVGGAVGVCPLPFDDARNQSVPDALNVRFDLAGGVYAGRSGDVVAPAQNVRKGYVAGPRGDWCAATPGAPGALVMGLDRDRCYTDTSGCGTTGVGNGDWDEARYEALNWSASQQPASSPANGATHSRYETYLNEIANGYTSAVSTGGEPGGPQCNRSAYSGAPPDTRRLISAAIVNCSAALAGAASPDTSPLPVLAFADLFLTAPANASTGEIWVEFVRVVQPGSASPAASLIHDTVVLAQ